jgi:glycerophosphoryl diester phosphodiesterase
MQTPLIVAHRGASQLAPENSLAAFELAIQKGADVIELDVHFSRDRQIVVHHDYYLGRTETGSGFIGTYSFSELQAFDLGIRFGGKFSGTRIPSLRDVLDLGKGRIRFEIEVRSPSLSFLKLVLEEVAQAGVLNDVEITSPHIPLLAHVKAIAASIRTGIFFPTFPAWMEKDLGGQHILDWLTLADAQVAHLPFALLDEGLIHRLHNQNLLVHGADLNRENEIGTAIRLEVDQFSTDTLETAVEIRDARKAS